MFPVRRTRRALALALTGLAAACSDATTPPSAPVTAIDLADASFTADAKLVFASYVAIGTSVSMGWASDGVTAASQLQSWPAQLGRLAGREISQPLIGGTGCQAPLRAPLATGVRISGEAAAAARGTLACALNVEGVPPSTQNVAINAALTRDALFTTPDNVTDPNNGPVYPRVLRHDKTQVKAALARRPQLVSVELGANEVLNVRTGIAIPGATMFPISAWAPLYTDLVNQVAAVAPRGVLVGLIRDVGTFPGFRRGAELYADRGTFLAAFNVTVADDCDGSPNLLFVPVRVPVAVATGLGRRAAGAGPHTLSCAGAPATMQDFVLTPSEISSVNAQLAAMNDHIRSEATRLNWAHFELEALYGRSDIKGPFSVVQLMTSLLPYGPLTSLDGMHPNGEGQRVIALAAANALDARYGFGLTNPLLIAGR